MPKKVKTTRATQSSVALQSAYFKKLMKHIDKMHRSAKWWMTACYRTNEDKIALDTSPVSELERELKEGMDKWRKEFDGIADEVGAWFVKRAKKHTDTSVLSALKDAGYTVKFKMPVRLRDTMQALVAQQVNLIKSIESQYFTDITGLVMRSVSEGRGLNFLTEELQNRYGITKDRAAKIARDQNNKATAAITHARYEELGITEAYWQHNAGSKDPRPEHLAADGKKYDITKGYLMKYAKGERRVFPGQEINCHCTSRPVIPEFGDGRTNDK